MPPYALLALWMLLCPASAPGAVPAVADDDAPDEVVLANGRSLEGRVVYQDDELVVLRVKSKDRELERTEVQSVSSVLGRLHELLDQLLGVPADDVPGLLAAADKAEQGGLPHEARLLRLRVLLLEPDNAAANAALENRELKKTGWEIKIGRKWHPTAELRSMGGEWTTRWELRTFHYQLATDLPLWDAIEAAFDLERECQEFYSLLGRETKLRDVTELMEVEVHAHASSYPEPGDGRPGHFDPSDRKLFVLAESIPARLTVAHEAVHQLFYMTTVRSQKGKGSIPSWLDEGLSEYMKSNVVSESGPLRFDRSTINRGHFRAHADDDKQFSLNRMLTMETGDFRASTHTDLKYGQAYSLVHFLKHGGDGIYRPVFFDFLRSCYAGQSSMTEFKDALERNELDVDEFEEAWHAYALGIVS